MKKILSLVSVLFLLSAGVSAPTFALIDMASILGTIPAYERANEQLNQFSKRWPAEIDAISLEAETLYKN